MVAVRFAMCLAPAAAGVVAWWPALGALATGPQMDMLEAELGVPLVRDLMQGAFRMRGLGRGQTISMLLTPEVVLLMRRVLDQKNSAKEGGTKAKRGGTKTSCVRAWALASRGAGGWGGLRSSTEQVVFFIVLPSPSLGARWKDVTSGGQRPCS